MISPPTALAWSIGAVAAVPVASGPGEKSVVAGLVAIAAIWAHRNPVPVLRALAITAPVFFLLVVIHGFVGPLFPVDAQVLGSVPLRTEGLVYGLDTGLTVLIVTFAAALWLAVSSDQLIDDLIWLRAPVAVTVMVGQTVATLSLLRRRVLAVYLAQRARGVPVRGSPLARLRALPAILVPSISGALVEADHRALMLTSRGFGARRARPLRPPPYSRFELVSAGALPAALTVAFVALRT